MVFQTGMTETGTEGNLLVEKVWGKDVWGQTFSTEGGEETPRMPWSHKCISTCSKSHYRKSKPKNFDEPVFLNDLKKKMFLTIFTFPIENSQYFIETFLVVVKKRVSFKKKIERVNQAPPMNRDFRKSDCTRSRLRNNYCKNPTSENQRLYKQQRKKVSLLVESSVIVQCARL